MLSFHLSSSFSIPSQSVESISGSHEAISDLYGNCSIDRVKNEIIILKNRSAEFMEQHESIDNIMLQKLESESTNGDVLASLKKLWVEDYEMEKERSLSIWNKKEKGLRQVFDKEIADKIDGLNIKPDEEEEPA